MSLSGKRKNFSGGVKVDTLIKQKLRCKNPKCRMVFTKERRPHFDHIKGRTNRSASNCQALCPNCHEIKNQKEAKAEAKRRRMVKK